MTTDSSAPHLDRGSVLGNSVDNPEESLPAQKYLKFYILPNFSAF
jgi:hypothetical protein